MKFKVVNKDGKTLPWKNYYLQGNGTLLERDARDGSIRPAHNARVVQYVGFGDHYVGENDVTLDYKKYGVTLTRTNIDVLDELKYQGHITEEEYNALRATQDEF